MDMYQETYGLPFHAGKTKDFSGTLTSLVSLVPLLVPKTQSWDEYLALASH